jgi:hypothetical protein
MSGVKSARYYENLEVMADETPGAITLFPDDDPTSLQQPVGYDRWHV